VTGRESLALMLFVAANSPASALALASLKNALERYAENPFQLEVVDVFAQPLRALQERVLVTPTLLVQPGARRIVGDLADANLLDYFLRSVSAAS
jgi:circadian clock protein KaiB